MTNQTPGERAEYAASVLAPEIDFLGDPDVAGLGRSLATVLRGAMENPAAVGQAWLTGDGDVNDTTDSTPILTVAGTATAVKGGARYPFSGSLVIDQSCFPAPPSTSQPGATPICLTRIVTPIFTSLALAQGGTLVLRVDPKALFNGVDFAGLPTFSGGPTKYGFMGCAGSDGPDVALFANLIGTAPYQFEWQPPRSK